MPVGVGDGRSWIDRRRPGSQKGFKVWVGGRVGRDGRVAFGALFDCVGSHSGTDSVLCYHAVSWQSPQWWHALQQFGWKKGYQYLRLDGKCNAKTRQRQNQLFQDPSSSAQVGHTRVCVALKPSMLMLGTVSTSANVHMLLTIEFLMHFLLHTEHV